MFPNVAVSLATYFPVGSSVKFSGSMVLGRSGRADKVSQTLGLQGWKHRESEFKEVK